jgi:hypothetical protein
VDCEVENLAGELDRIANFLSCDNLALMIGGVEDLLVRLEEEVGVFCLHVS